MKINVNMDENNLGSIYKHLKVHKQSKNVYLCTKKPKGSNLRECYTTNKHNQNQRAMTNPRTNRNFRIETDDQIHNCVTAW